jgi:2-polyprenyl-3-methyl-5-hydroxy-6-metoxy-1,4-benzoquinol methylase
MREAMADRALLDVARRLSMLTPAPPSLRSLGPRRARLVDELLARRRLALADSHALYARDRSAGRRAFGEIAENVVAELRRELVASSLPISPAGVAARFDARFATDGMEHIDDPNFSEAHRTRLLDTLDRINERLGSYAHFLAAIAPLIDGRPTTILDVASGHGGFAIALAKLARERGLRLTVVATDLREEYLAIGRKRAAEEGVEVEFLVADAFDLDAVFHGRTIDVVTCTQSLHHFGPALTAGLIAECARVATRGIVFVDALRALSRYILLVPLTLLATRDPAFTHDATLSIRRSLVPEELAAIARCTPGAERLESFYLPPAFNVLRSRRPA